VLDAIGRDVWRGERHCAQSARAPEDEPGETCNDDAAARVQTSFHRSIIPFRAPLWAL
jgi:hypothetical protein